MSGYIFVNGVDIYKFKAKDYEINAASIGLGNVSKYFSIDNLKKSGLYGYVYDFSVDYDRVDVNYLLDIYKYFIKKYNTKQCLNLLKKCLLDYQALAQ